MGSAIEMLRHNAQRRAAISAVGASNVVDDAFRFVDSDGSGCMGVEQLKDGFAAMGVNLADGVADNVLRTFDADGSGQLRYHDFCRMLFVPKPGS